MFESDRSESATDRLSFHCGYYADPISLKALNAFAYEIFGGLDFGPWNALGFDFPEYTPFSYFDSGRVIANVSASAMNLWVAGRAINTVQIGTVGTRPEWRRRGLIRACIEKAHAHWEDTRSLFFLFANETTAGFYQQFGYRRMAEHRFTASAPAFIRSTAPARPLNMTVAADRDLLFRLAENRQSVSNVLGVHRQSWLLLFHAAVIYPNRVFYAEALDAAVIAFKENGTLNLIDVIGERVPPLREIYPYIGAPEIRTIVFGFIPDRMEADGVTISESPESLTFVRGEFGLENEPILFPLTSQA